jgi:hypothetical protein
MDAKIQGNGSCQRTYVYHFQLQRRHPILSGRRDAVSKSIELPAAGEAMVCLCVRVKTIVPQFIHSGFPRPARMIARARRLYLSIIEFPKGRADPARIWRCLPLTSQLGVTVLVGRRVRRTLEIVLRQTLAAGVGRDG